MAEWRLLKYVQLGFDPEATISYEVHLLKHS
jgi:hypothetical protein